MPHLAAMTHHCHNRELTVAMVAAYDLEPKHVSLVTGSGEDTNKVQDIVAEARELAEAAAVEGSEGAFAGGTATGGIEGDEPERDDPDEGPESDSAEETDPDGTESSGAEQSGLGDFS
jgi:replication factor C large subunit